MKVRGDQYSIQIMFKRVFRQKIQIYSALALYILIIIYFDYGTTCIFGSNYKSLTLVLKPGKWLTFVCSIQLLTNDLVFLVLRKVNIVLYFEIYLICIIANGRPTDNEEIVLAQPIVYCNKQERQLLLNSDTYFLQLTCKYLGIIVLIMFR